MRVPAPGRPTKERGSAQPSAAGCQTPGPGAHQGLTPQALALSGPPGRNGLHADSWALHPRD